MQLATTSTHATLAATRTLLTWSYRVSSILISNASAAAITTVTITDADDVTKAIITVPKTDTVDWTVDMIWDNGMKASAAAPTADTTITVAHSAAGV